MADVAAHAGVSHQTVSRVLNDSPLVKGETRERVLTSIVALGYRRNNAARMLATNRSRRIGMISAHLALFGPSRIAASMQDAVHAAGYEISLVGLSDLTPADLRGAVDRLLDQAVEAIVIAVAHEAALDAARTLDLPIPVVLTQGIGPDEKLAAGIDQEAGAYAATAHLLDLGHTPRRPRDRPARLGRGDPAPCRLASTPTRSAGCCPAPSSPATGPRPAATRRGAASAADRDVSAVFVGNDAMCLGVLTGLHEHGLRVPDDVSVVGFDDVPEAEFYWPPLTTVRQEFEVLGARAVALALEALEGQVRVPVELVAPELVVRRSTAPAPPR